MINYSNSVIISPAGYWLNTINPYNPLNLPGLTIRVKMNAGADAPTVSRASVTPVAGQADVYDICTEIPGGRQTNWIDLTRGNLDLIEILGANVWNSNYTACASLEYAFQSTTNLSKVALFDTSSISNMYYTFAGCPNLTSIPLFDTSSVTNMQGMFHACTHLTTVPLFDTSNVTNMQEMFQACLALETVPLFDTSKVTNMECMFFDCTHLTTVPLFNTSMVTDMSQMFYNCYRVESGALALYQQASSQTNPPTDHTLTFDNCGRDTDTGLAELRSIPQSWGGLQGK